MNIEQALNTLLKHKDPEVRAAAAVVREQYGRRSRILKLVKEALSQLRVDIKYLAFDLECTRRERDEARGVI